MAFWAICVFGTGGIGIGWGDLLAPRQAAAEEAQPVEDENDAQRRILMKAMQVSVNNIRSALRSDAEGQRLGIVSRSAWELSGEARRVAKFPPKGNDKFSGLANKLSEDAGALSRSPGDDLNVRSSAAPVFKSWAALKKSAQP
jgi:hypothetical protein